jgi:hypothetical protein
VGRGGSGDVPPMSIAQSSLLPAESAQVKVFEYREDIYPLKYTLQNLEPFTEYSVKVTARNDKGYSTSSLTRTAKTLGQPSRLASATVSVASSTSLSVIWAAADDFSSEEVSAFVVETWTGVPTFAAQTVTVSVSPVQTPHQLDIACAPFSFNGDSLTTQAQVNYTTCDFTACGGDQYYFTTNCYGTDTIIRLYDGDGNYISENDDGTRTGADAQCSDLGYTFSASGCRQYSLHQGCFTDADCHGITTISYPTAEFKYGEDSGFDYLSTTVKLTIDADDNNLGGFFKLSHFVGDVLAESFDIAVDAPAEGYCSVATAIATLGGPNDPAVTVERQLSRRVVAGLMVNTSSSDSVLNVAEGSESDISAGDIIFISGKQFTVARAGLGQIHIEKSFDMDGFIDTLVAVS